MELEKKWRKIQILIPTNLEFEFERMKRRGRGQEKERESQLRVKMQEMKGPGWGVNVLYVYMDFLFWKSSGTVMPPKTVIRQPTPMFSSVVRTIQSGMKCSVVVRFVEYDTKPFSVRKTEREKKQRWKAPETV